MKEFSAATIKAFHRSLLTSSGGAKHISNYGFYQHRMSLSSTSNDQSFKTQQQNRQLNFSNDVFTNDILRPKDFIYAFKNRLITHTQKDEYEAAILTEEEDIIQAQTLLYQTFSELKWTWLSENLTGML